MATVAGRPIVATAAGPHASPAYKCKISFERKKWERDQTFLSLLKIVYYVWR